MSDSDSDKKSRVPLWQLKPGESVVEETETTPAETPSRAIVIEKAKKFLQEDEVKDASADKKIQFLETKGLTKEEIEGLLGVSSNEEATSLKVSLSKDHIYHISDSGIRPPNPLNNLYKPRYPNPKQQSNPLLQKLNLLHPNLYSDPPRPSLATIPRQ